jgi:hypothetical protein
LLYFPVFEGEEVIDNWAKEELGGADLGDVRLNNRRINLATRFAGKPMASIPGDWAETQAAYLFFEQSSQEKRRLDWRSVLEPNTAMSKARMRQHPVVLCLQDTTGTHSTLLCAAASSVPSATASQVSRRFGWACNDCVTLLRRWRICGKLSMQNKLFVTL